MMKIKKRGELIKVKTVVHFYNFHLTHFPLNIELVLK